MFFFLKYIQGIESLGHKVKYVQFYKVLPNCFSKRIYHFCIPLTMHWSFSCSIPCQHLVLSVFIMLAILVGMYWCLIVVVIC